MLKFKHFLLASVLVGLIPAAGALATVTLQFTDLVGNLTQGSADKGTNFSVRLNLVSTSEQTTGLDYYLNALGSGAGKFAIVDRNMTGSSYSDPSYVDATVETKPDSVLNPLNAWDLGASLNNVNSPLGTGTFLVANYIISIAPNTPNGSYTIEAYSQTGTGWVGTGPTFPESSFAPPTASYNIIVTPEPASLGLLAVASLALIRRRRVG